MESTDGQARVLYVLWYLIFLMKNPLAISCCLPLHGDANYKWFTSCELCRGWPSHTSKTEFGWGIIFMWNYVMKHTHTHKQMHIQVVYFTCMWCCLRRFKVTLTCLAFILTSTKHSVGERERGRERQREREREWERERLDGEEVKRQQGGTCQI